MIGENVQRILQGLPEGVELVGAAKTRTPEEILEAVEAGLTIIGENYVQEAENAFEVIGNRVKWHMIGHLQRNKVKKAVKVFDMIETVDSMRLAREIDKCCGNLGGIMPVLIEINSGEEDQKAGVMPDDAMSLIKEMSPLEHLRIMGLMTMGPFAGDPEDARPFFQKTRELYDMLRGTEIPDVTMQYLSMGMSNSYKVALEEGANLVRIGTMIFGERT
ncbi:MAG: YggS family pyridoxal phosphate-dependent enzyme [Deltaproteobacteria bacterium]|nr:YggS family pyridoxal phosphate-dependent enzyme [Deltaproteobacteria bacterium]